jgi:hypothetical protein
MLGLHFNEIQLYKLNLNCNTKQIKPKRKANKMKTLKVSTALAATILICALIASGCSQNPANSQFGTENSRTAGKSGPETDTKDKSILVNVFLKAGEKYIVSASNFDQYGLDGFSAVSLEIFDPRLPVYQPDRCGDVEIFVDYDGKIVRGNCSASKFKTGEIVLVNNADIGLEVAATIFIYSDEYDNTSK